MWAFTIYLILFLSQLSLMALFCFSYINIYKNGINYSFTYYHKFNERDYKFYNLAIPLPNSIAPSSPISVELIKLKYTCITCIFK